MKRSTLKSREALQSLQFHKRQGDLRQRPNIPPTSTTSTSKRRNLVAFSKVSCCFQMFVFCVANALQKNVLPDSSKNAPSSSLRPFVLSATYPHVRKVREAHPKPF